jgi:hypothetical protein
VTRRFADGSLDSIRALRFFSLQIVTRVPRHRRRRRRRRHRPRLHLLRRIVLVTHRIYNVAYISKSLTTADYFMLKANDHRVDIYKN